MAFVKIIRQGLAFYMFLVLYVEAAKTKKPNFVILLADDLGIGDIGCFGNYSMKTPNVDKIAAEGAKLSHHLSTAAVCTPSRAALLTGRYPVRQGMEANGLNKVLIFLASQGGLPKNETTFAKVLQQSGYRTSLIGKWHLGMYCKSLGDNCHHPSVHGFEHFYGLPLTNLKDFGTDGDSVITTYIPQIHSLINSVIIIGLMSTFLMFKNRNFITTFLILVLLVFLPVLAKLFIKNFGLLNSVLMRDNEVVEQPIILNGLTQRFVRESVNFIEDKKQSEVPFLLVFSFAHAHTALFTAPEFANKSKHGRYGDNVEELDWAVGQVLETLEKNGLKDNTFVFFSSDNGGHLEELGLDGQREGGYNGLFKGGKCMGGMEGGIRVPTVAMWPGVIPPKLEITVPTSQMDIFPTILEMAGENSKSNAIIDGKSIFSMLKGIRNKPLHNILYHYCGDEIHAVRYIDENYIIWKVHYYLPNWIPGTYQCEYVCHCFGKHVKQQDPPLLFNLSDDPYEDKPLNITNNPKLLKLLAHIKKEKTNHELSVDKVPSQFTFLNSLWKPWLQPCCNFPTCNCVEN